MEIPHVTRWISIAAGLVAVLALALFLLLSGCAPGYGGWTRAEVQTTPHQQQVRLDKDREACITEGTAKGIYYQALLGEVDLIACLERRGWKRVPLASNP